MGRRPGVTNNTRYHRNLSLALREYVDPDLMRKYLFGILQGKSPVFVEARGEDGETEWDVDFEKECITPTLDQRMRALEMIANRAWGMPVQAHVLEGVIRDESSGQALQLTGLPASTLHAMRELLEKRAPAALPSPRESNADAVDAEIVSETPAPVELSES